MQGNYVPDMSTRAALENHREENEAIVRLQFRAAPAKADQRAPAERTIMSRTAGWSGRTKRQPIQWPRTQTTFE